MGGDLGGMGNGPPDILRNIVVGCVRKYEQSKKCVIKEFFSEISEIVVFLVRKGFFRPPKLGARSLPLKKSGAVKQDKR